MQLLPHGTMTMPDTTSPNYGVRKTFLTFYTEQLPDGTQPAKTEKIKGNFN